MKRGADNFSGSGANAKKERLDDCGKAAAQNNRNRQSAATDSTESRNLYETGKHNIDYYQNLPDGADHWANG